MKIAKFGKFSTPSVWICEAHQQPKPVDLQKSGEAQRQWPQIAPATNGVGVARSRRSRPAPQPEPYPGGKTFAGGVHIFEDDVWSELGPTANSAIMRLI